MSQAAGHPSRPANQEPALKRQMGFLSQLRRFGASFGFSPDHLISLILLLAGIYAYSSTLAPTVIEGDAALFQYTPYVLGVTYPTGFPFYILLGKLWVTLFPFGEIAWRMNLLSALCSALALPFFYNAARRLYAPQPARDAHLYRGAALIAILTIATIPTYWRWSTEAKTYGLNMLLFSVILYSLAKALAATSADESQAVSPTLSSTPQDQLAAFQVGWFRRFPLVLPTFLIGLLISVHNTGVLLLPGFLAMIWLYFRDYLRSLKSLVFHLLLLILPGLFYLYIPLRAEWLIAQFDRQEAIARGLLADFYQSGFQGLLRYFSGVGFTEGLVTNWALVPQQVITVYLPLLTDEFTRLGLGLGLVGGLAFAINQPRRFLPLFLMYIVPIPFVLVYGQGEQSAFLLPSFFIFALFVGYSPILVGKLLGRFVRPVDSGQPGLLRVIVTLLTGIILIILLFYPQLQHNVNWLSNKWSYDIHDEWSDALDHPLEPGAGMLAHWGDLTSFWYMQHAEGRRPDLRGVYPPDEAVVINWYQHDSSNLYIAGPLQGWAAGIQDRYQLIPWGRLVRIAPSHIDPASLMPDLSLPVETDFGQKLHLIGADFRPTAIGGQDFPVTLAWRSLAELSPGTTVSLRLSQEDAIVAQLDDSLRSGWFPSETLPADQHVLSYAPLPVPLGTLPGEYRLQLVIYTDLNQPWLLQDGSAVLDLGSVLIESPAPDDWPDLGHLKALPQHDFNGEIELLGYDYSVRRVGQGKGFNLELLWQAQAQPADNYLLLVDIIDSEGDLLRRFERTPTAGRAATASWQAGQIIRDQLDVVVPASAPVGQQTIRIRLQWQRPDGSILNVRRWWLPLDDSLTLDGLNVVEKQDRSFEIPVIPHRLEANLENKIRLLGYSTSMASDQHAGGLQLDLAACQAENNQSCEIDLQLYWQGLAEMDIPYTIFFHVVNERGQIVAQQDRQPGPQGKDPTSGWLPGEVIDHPVRLLLPESITPGQYTLRAGLYVPPLGPRLFLLDQSDERISDFVDIDTITVTKP